MILTGIEFMDTEHYAGLRFDLRIFQDNRDFHLAATENGELEEYIEYLGEISAKYPQNSEVLVEKVYQSVQ